MTACWTVAVAFAILHGQDYAAAFGILAVDTRHAGYGGAFRDWLWREGCRALQ